MRDDGDLKVKEHAIWAISNALHKGTPQQVLNIVKEHRFFEAAMVCLQTLKDESLVNVMLESVQFALEGGKKLPPNDDGRN